MNGCQRSTAIRLTYLALVAASLLPALILRAQTSSPDTAAPQSSPSVPPETHAIAIVPLDSKIPGAAAEVTGSLQVVNGRAFISANGTWRS